MKNIITRVLTALSALVLLSAPAMAQTAATTTTLGAAQDNLQRVVTVASATGITAPGTGSTLVFLLVDKELEIVRAVNGTAISVTRGAKGTRSTAHLNAAPVSVLVPQQLVEYVPSGQCQRTLLSYVPLVLTANSAVGQQHAGDTYDCLGVTTAGQWTQSNANGVGVLGSTMASTNGVLGLFTGTVFTISGANAITGFTNPAGIQPGFSVYIVPSGTFTWTAAGNIALAGTAVVNKLIIFTWNGSKWIPSVIA